MVASRVGPKRRPIEQAVEDPGASVLLTVYQHTGFVYAVLDAFHSSSQEVHLRVLLQGSSGKAVEIDAADHVVAVFPQGERQALVLPHDLQSVPRTGDDLLEEGRVVGPEAPGA